MANTDTQSKRVAKIEADLPAAYAALRDIELALLTGDAATIAAAAKTLEAFGCYVRRTKIGD